MWHLNVGHWYIALGLVAFVHLNGICNASNDIEISKYIRKCCVNGLRHARMKQVCQNFENEVASIPPLWIGLCHSTFGVCCSREIEKHNCEMGRLAALAGSRCDEILNSTSYVDCCRACQVGLAVKASTQQCIDPLFAYISSIESYRVCCLEGDGIGTVLGEQRNDADAFESNKKQNQSYVLDNAKIDGDDEVDDTDSENENENDNNKSNNNNNNNDDDVETDVAAAEDNADGVIVLHDGDDICSEYTNLCEQICESTFSAYQCKCKPGFKLDDNNITCSSVHNAAAEKSQKTGQEQAAAPIANCKPGFKLQDLRCVDINECLEDENVCDSTQECKNLIGHFDCDCKVGFNLDGTTNACVDINECSINNHNCLPTQRCDNTIGSYICTRLQSCGTGYTLNAETGNCDDDDECALNTHTCPADYACLNTKGSFRCHRRPTPTMATTTTTASTTTSTTASSHPWHAHPYVAHQTYSNPNYISSSDAARLQCSLGFTRSHLGACVDINECKISKPCGSHQRCINTNGSYRCENLLQCAAGFKSTTDGTSCMDIDECETGEHNCAENQSCRNRIGGFVCLCPPGHQLMRLGNSTHNRCVDINECAHEVGSPSVCPSNAHCLNTIGSYYCECKTGFQKKSGDMDNKHYGHAQCYDIDECQEIPGLCQQKCVNFWGGYRCTCHPGYELSSDNRTCNDIDECELNKSYKLCMGYCNNVPGSYECACPRGYILAADKNTCRDNDECETGDVCTGRYDICTNIRGSFKCTTISCPYGYTNDVEQKNRCRQVNNYCEGDECYNKPSAYTFNFITLVSKLMMPPEGRTIFTLRGPSWYDDIDFDLKIVRIQAAPNIEKASDMHFDTFKGRNQVNLILKRTLEGPQDVELELSMTVFTNGMPRGKSIAKIFVYVSQYTF